MAQNVSYILTGFNSSSIPDSRRASEYLREYMLNSYSPDNAISSVYRETLKSLLVLFGRFYYKDAENKLQRVRCIPGRQERTIADLTKNSNLELPIISISHFTTIPDKIRQRNESIVVHETMWDEDKQRAVRVISFPPRPVDVVYSIAIWSKYRENLDQIIEQLLLEFNPSKVINTKFNHYTKAFLLTEEDNSIESVEDGQDRVLKKVYNIVVETYIPQPAFRFTNTGSIEVFNSDIYTDDVVTSPSSL